MERVETLLAGPLEHLGFGGSFLWICTNNECPLFVNGWKNMAEKYGELTSIRYMIEPDSGETGVFPVPSASVFETVFRSKTGTPNPEHYWNPKRLET
jgi:hypothetical protein